MSVASMKEDRRLKNRELRRKDPTIRQIKNGKVTKRYEDTPYEVSRESLMQEIKKDFEGGKPLVSKKDLQPHRLPPMDDIEVLYERAIAEIKGDKPPEPTQEVAPAEVSTPVEVSAPTAEVVASTEVVTPEKVVTPVEEPATVEVVAPVVTVEVSSPAEAPAPEEIKE